MADEQNPDSEAQKTNASETSTDQNADATPEAQAQPLFNKMTAFIIPILGIILCFFTLYEVNFSNMQSQSALAIFVMIGTVLCFLTTPVHPKLKDDQAFRWLDVFLSLVVVMCCGYVFVQSEDTFKSLWSGGESLANRAGAETRADIVIGFIGLILVFESTRRAIGWIVPILALSFVAHAYYCYGAQNYGWPGMPDWMLPGTGKDVEDIVSTTYLQTLGVFGQAASVMFKYVFLFVVFGAFLEMSGATQFIIDFAERVFGNSPGGPAKVSVLGSGLMGSLSGSAVANAVTTGAFTIPMMRNAGFDRHVAGGITAAAASGGALVPPVMGAGAYMMLELVEPQVNFLQVAKAALIPAILYYLSIFMIVHYYSRRVGAKAINEETDTTKPIWRFEAVVFFGALGVLVGLLIWSFTPFKAVTGSLIAILFLSIFRKELKMGMAPRVLALGVFVLTTIGHQVLIAETVDEPNTRQIFESVLESTLIATFFLLVFGLIHPAWRPAMMKALGSSARNGVSLVVASACVGVIIGIVQNTGIANNFNAAIGEVVQTNLFLALFGIMVCSLIMGMGVPSVVCYLLMATLMGTLLKELGVIPLSAHLFIFYFGMMSMVTPPVALAAYASASIAEAKIMPTALAAFRFSLVGFTLPFMFVYRPELTLQSDTPEVTIVSYRKKADTAEPGDLRVTFQKFGDAVSETNVVLTPAGGGDEVTVKTNSFGGIKSPLEPGTWDISIEQEDGMRRVGNVEIYDTPRDKDSVTKEEKENKSYHWGRFSDHRLSILSVILSTLSAIIGITALSIGLSGYMARPLGLASKIMMFGAAVLLLYPDRYTVMNLPIPISDLAGFVLFGITAAKVGRSEVAQEDVD